MGKSIKSIKSIKTGKIDTLIKIKKRPLDYVQKNIPAKIGDDLSILRQKKMEMIKRDRRTGRQTDGHTDIQTYRHT